MTQPYQTWFEEQLKTRSRRYSSGGGRVKISVITAIYDKTDVGFLRETAQSILTQRHANLEWIVTADGPIPNELLVAIQLLRRDSRVRFFARPKGGIIRTMRWCLERATGDYLVPVDGDDLISHDALEIFSGVIRANGEPPFLYSDEDHLIEGKPDVPYFRPAWDPVLNTSSSFVWHLIAFSRKLALELGVYDDELSNWCHDWDTVFRFADAGHTPIHVPEVLYHWRQHAASSTNRPNPVSDSLLSQKHVLEKHLARKGVSAHFDIEEFPVFRGAKEWWLRRKRESERAVDVILVASRASDAVEAVECLRASCGPRLSRILVCGLSPVESASLRSAEPSLEIIEADGLAGLREAISRATGEIVVVADDQVRWAGEEWLWEAESHFDLHPDCALISARLLDGGKRVGTGGEIFGLGGLVGVPNEGVAHDDAGMFALYLKPRSVSAVNARFFVAHRDFLIRAVGSLPRSATLSALGVWLGAAASDAGLRVVFSPLVAGNYPGQVPRMEWGEGERETFLGQHQDKIPDRRWFLPHAPLADRARLREEHDVHLCE